MKMLFQFGCQHSKLSWPLTLKRRTYVVCLSCGKEFLYDWERMEIVSESPTTRPVSRCEAVE